MNVSIIIAFQKGIHYLTDCLDSIVEQNLSNYEVILVNDGKEEKLHETLDFYKETLPIRVLKTKENMGVAAARNLGLYAAIGTYIYFLDSDDYLLEGTLATLLSEANRSNADVVMGERVSTWFKRYSFLQEETEEIIQKIVEKERELTKFTVHNLLIKKAFINKHELSFEETLFVYSDIPFAVAVHAFSREIKIVRESVYVERKHNDEVRLPSLKQLIVPDRHLQYLKAYKLSIFLLQEQEKDNGRKQKLYNIQDILKTNLEKYICKFYSSMLHGEQRLGFSEEEINLFGIELNNIYQSYSLWRKYTGHATGHVFTYLERQLLKAMRKKNAKAVLTIGNLIVILKKRKGLFGDKIQRARALDMLIFQKLEVKSNWIIFESFLGKTYGDSCKYIYEYMLKHYGKKYKYIWILKDKKTKIPGNPTIVPRFSWRYFYYFARSKYWVNNMRQPLWMKKREEQIFLETWHGTPLKKLVFDMDDVHSASPKYKVQFYMQSRKWDYLISDNPFSTEVFQSAFLMEREKILELGYPRNDLLYAKDKENHAIKIKQTLSIPINKKVILYAPTWRDDDYYGPGKYKFTLELDLKRLEEEVGEEYIILLRTHYFIADQLDITGLENFAYNVSKYDDIGELYLISDICITDYSSVFFDFANLQRPILFFTYDLEKYRDILRGFYIDMETELPGPLLLTNDEVIDSIQNISRVQAEYEKKYKQFYKRFCCLDDGLATKRIVEKVFEL